MVSMRTNYAKCVLVGGSDDKNHVNINHFDITVEKNTNTTCLFVVSFAQWYFQYMCNVSYVYITAW